MKSNCKALSKRFQSGFKAIAKRLQSDCEAMAQRIKSAKRSRINSSALNKRLYLELAFQAIAER
jgi:hypothetical protein